MTIFNRRDFLETVNTFIMKHKCDWLDHIFSHKGFYNTIDVKLVMV